MYTVASIVWGSLWKVALRVHHLVVWTQFLLCSPVLIPMVPASFFAVVRNCPLAPRAFARITKQKGFLSSVFLTTNV